MSFTHIPFDLFWEASKGKLTGTLSFSPVAQTILTVAPPPNVWVAAGPIGSGASGTLYPYNAPASTVAVVSTSVNDTGAGTGARTVLISGSTSPGNLTQTEAITLNGTTTVTSTLTFLTVNGLSRTLEVGSLGEPAGDISFRLSGVLVHRIRAGFNQDVQASATLFADSTSFFFNQSYWADKHTEFKFQILDPAIVNSGFIDQDLVTITHPNDEHITPFDKAPLRVPLNGRVQTILRAKFPNTTAIVTARAAFVPLASL